LSKDCYKYGANNIYDNVLAKATSIYGDARNHVEKEQEDFNRLLSSQVVFFIVLIKILIKKIVLIEMRTFWISTSWSFLNFFYIHVNIKCSE
jgi:hypothetical protein